MSFLLNLLSFASLWHSIISTSSDELSVVRNHSIYKWKFSCVTEKLNNKNRDTLNSLIFSQINSYHSMPLFFNSHPCAVILTSLAHTSGLRLVSFMSVSKHTRIFSCRPPHSLHFSIMSPTLPLTWLCPVQAQLIKGETVRYCDVCLFSPWAAVQLQQWLWARLGPDGLQKKKKKSLKKKISICEHKTCTVKDNCSALGKGCVLQGVLCLCLHRCVSVSMTVCIMWQQTSLRTSNHSIQHLLPHSSYCHSAV